MNTVPSTLTMGVLGFTSLVLALAIVYQFYHARQKREMFEAALAAGQADVAKALIATNWFAVVLRLLMIALVFIILVPSYMGMTMGLTAGLRRAREAGFTQTVERITGAPLGTMEVMIGGHKAYGCLTGNGWANQSCGSRYHPQLRFSTETPGFLNVFYIPDLQQYYVFGRARVDPSGKVVENGTISVVEAMGPAK